MNKFLVLCIFLTGCSSAGRQLRNKEIAACQRADRHMRLTKKAFPNFDPTRTGQTNSKGTAEKFCLDDGENIKENARFCYFLGKMYEKEEFIQCARRWYRYGCDHKNSSSCFELKLLKDYGDIL